MLLLAIGVGEVLYLRGVVGGDDEPAQAPVSAERPVQLPDLEVRRVVDQAATAGRPDPVGVLDRLRRPGRQGDGDDDRRRSPRSTARPRPTSKEQFVAAQTEVVVDISAQGVVSATDDEVVALLFLTQTTQKGTRGGVTPVQYRVTVTMVNTSDGWLVSDLVAL